MFPNESIIEPRQTLDIEFQFMSSKLGKVEDLYVPCYVQGRKNPNWLSVKAQVTGLNVEYKVMTLDQDGQQHFSETADSTGKTRKTQY